MSLNILKNKEMENNIIVTNENKATSNLMDKMRQLAREVLRARWINNVKDVIATIDKSMKTNDDQANKIGKEKARIDYKISKLEEANPDYQELLSNLQEKITMLAKELEINTNDAKDLTEQKNEQLKKIENIEAGILLVDADNLSAKTKELVEEFYKNEATKVK